MEKDFYLYRCGQPEGSHKNRILTEYTHRFFFMAEKNSLIMLYKEIKSTVEYFFL